MEMPTLFSNEYAADMVETPSHCSRLSFASLRACYQQISGSVTCILQT